jgi:hypothetical protein
MPRSSGTYTLPAGNPVVTGTTITSTWANTTLSDIATALTGSVATDGTSGMTGILQMGNNKITGVADGTASSDVATVNQISNPTITGGTIDGAPIGASNPKNGAFLALSANNAAFSGTSTALTVTPSSDNSTKIATTAFVQSAITAISSGVTSFNTRSGAVTLTSGDVTTALGYTPYNASGATVVTSSNISTYAPTVNGTGAVGTWGISISGNAATATTATTATNATTVTNGVYTTGTQTITGDKTFSGLILSAAYNFTSNTSIYYAGGQYTFAAAGSNIAFLTSSGNFEITGATATKASGTTWANPSDVRLKDNIASFTKGLDVLTQINPKTWVYNGKGGTTAGTKGLGVIADEVQNIIPESVDTYKAKLNKNDSIEIDIKRFDATEITWLLVNSVKELKAELDAAKAEIAALKG